MIDFGLDLDECRAGLSYNRRHYLGEPKRENYDPGSAAEVRL